MNADDLPPLLAELTRRYEVPGAQLAIRWKGRTLTAVTGEHVLGAGPPVTPRSCFPLGSITKPFTAAVAMELVAAGDVDLDAPLVKYLPAFGAGRVATFRQVLSHTAGLPANVREDTCGDGNRLRWVARHCREADLAYPPGTVFSYSNVGYIVAGLLIEEITGLSWEEAVDAFVLDPLGVKACPDEEAGPRLVGGHAVNAARGTVFPIAAQNLPALEAPNGALALSAEDLVTFARLFLTEDGLTGPLGRETTGLMCRDQLHTTTAGPFGLADGWGLGWALYGDAGTAGHDGTGEGTSCHLRFEPAGGTVVALTTNANTGQAMWTALLERLRAAGVAVEDHFPALGLGSPVPARDDLLGTFVNDDSAFEIGRAADGKVHLSLGDRPYGELTCYEDLRFIMRELSGAAQTHTGRFVRDPATKRIEFLQISGRLARRRDGVGSGHGSIG
ncbi:serine hydrolase domain-containing protein [Sphaerisporangium sp. NPDC051011]|uniref:serine hydrolase domain-containing protein n=1 Tax=Sphaerisporangium sp. NPDC051011 TaxID=3155792 RepID=UPI0033D3DF93